MTTDRPDDKRMPLVRLVVFGTVLVTLAGLGLFWWLAWLLARQPLPLRGDSGWWDWLAYVNGPELFDAARTTATLLAIVGVGGAALVAYRRQDTAERSHAVAIEGQQIANAQHTLDSQKYELDRSRHELEVKRRSDDRERELRSRFTTVAEQLGSDNFAVRHGGAYALAALADDWHLFGNDAERQVCVNLLCAQLRSPRQKVSTQFMGGVHLKDVPEDLEVRNTIIALIREHRPLNAAKTDGWKSCLLDLSGADLSGARLDEVDLSDINLEEANLTGVLAVRADLSNAKMRRAILTGVELTGAKMPNADLYEAHSEWGENSEYGPPEFGRCDLRATNFVAVTMPAVQFPGADLTGAAFGSGKIPGANFNKAKLHKTKLWITLEKATFKEADVRGTLFTTGRPRGGARFIDVNFHNAVYDANTKWPRDEIPEGAVLGSAESDGEQDT